MNKKLNSILGAVCISFLGACSTTAEKEVGVNDLSPDNHDNNVTLQEDSGSDGKKEECYDSGNALEFPIPYVNIPLDNECKPDN